MVVGIARAPDGAGAASALVALGEFRLTVWRVLRRNGIGGLLIWASMCRPVHYQRDRPRELVQIDITKQSHIPTPVGGCTLGDEGRGLLCGVLRQDP